MPQHRAMILMLLVALLTTNHGLADTPDVPDSPARVAVYYFHGHFRCQTCMKIEDLAHYCVTETLASDIDSGELAWLAANYEKKEYAHFAEAFKIEGPCLIIALYSGENLQKWTNLEKVWDLTEDSKAFDAYVIGAAQEYLEAASLLASP
jgi:hypothetical protein